MQGRKLSDQTRKKMSETKKGVSTWNKGLTKDNDERIKKLGEKMTGRKASQETKKKMSLRSKGNARAKGSKRTLQFRENVSNFHSGPQGPNWKGGVSKNKNYRNNQRLRALKNSTGFHSVGEWELLKKQYGFKCPCCKKIEPEIKLTKDHIIPLIKGGSNFIENIQPLCKSCNSKKHTKIVKYGF